ncbi:hypothetical protein [Vulgatibacter incomptus]|uniref:Uncharacterized protein n=1 Tax=Vulgatibacter incomptus TaxID=1391653 RepID=A0A0K1PF56_9BACT|nr:hypothetical protein [Vulgatibacter incomptus]AKU92056.1 hypothetical protein AKJ08_2443 [Vulgatibacter incomptus]
MAQPNTPGRPNAATWIKIGLILLLLIVVFVWMLMAGALGMAI